MKQVKVSEGFLQGQLMATPNLSMWTMTLWTSKKSVREFYLSGSHQSVMGKMSEWTCEAVHITYPNDWEQLPPWTEMTQLLSEEGHFVLLTHPSENHLKRFIPQPHLTFTLKI